MHNTILIIEDDKEICEGIRVLLETAEYKVAEAHDGKTGLDLLSPEVSLVILDIMMPGMSGIEVCRRIREYSTVPILFLSAKSSETDRINGLAAGGDDYLVKPFSSMELFARVKAIIRRHQIYDQLSKNKGQQPVWLEYPPVKINASYNYVLIDNQEIHLTDMEYRILLLFIRNPNKIFSISNIYESVWDEPFFSSSANNVMVHIKNLRSKIEKDIKKPRIITTVWGKGYKLG